MYDDTTLRSPILDEGVHAVPRPAVRDHQADSLTDIETPIDLYQGFRLPANLSQASLGPLTGTMEKGRLLTNDRRPFALDSIYIPSLCNTSLSLAYLTNPFRQHIPYLASTDLGEQGRTLPFYAGNFMTRINIHNDYDVHI